MRQQGPRSTAPSGLRPANDQELGVLEILSLDIVAKKWPRVANKSATQGDPKRMKRLPHTTASHVSTRNGGIRVGRAFLIEIPSNYPRSCFHFEDIDIHTQR